MRKRRVLLITSTIAPTRGGVGLRVTDVRSRLDEYRQAFAFYVQLLAKGTVDRIVYADNSGHPLDDLRAIAEGAGQSAHVEFLSLRSCAEPSWGRYGQEMDLIDAVFQRSGVIGVDSDALIWKITGRYVVANIARIIEDAPETFDLYVNCRNLPMRFLDFFLVAFQAGAYKRILARDPTIYRSGSLSGEIVLRRRIDEGGFSDSVIVPRFRHVPRVTGGRRGSDGGSYSSLRESAKYVVRRLGRVLAPWVWI